MTKAHKTIASPAEIGLSHSQVVPPTETLLHILKITAEAPTSTRALEELFLYLKECHALYALALELMTGHVTHYLPFGDTGALRAMAQEEIPESAVVTHICPLNDPNAPPGQLTFVFARETGLTPEILQAATMQVALRLGQETLLKRAEEAEDKARQRISEVATIYEIGQAVDQIELSNLLQLITDRTARLMDAQACSLMILNRETGVLRVEAQHGLSEDAIDSEQHVGEGIAGRVAQNEQPMLLVGSIRDPRLDGLELRPDISSSMLVPMKDQEGGILGVLSIRRRRPAPDFTDDDLRLFSIFAAQAALAVTNYNLYANLDRRANELAKISSLTRALISTLDLDQLLTRVVEEVCQIVGFERCCLYLRDGGKSIYAPRVWRGYTETIARNHVREGEGAVGAAARNKTTLIFDAHAPVMPDQEKERLYLQLKGFARSLGTDSFIVEPILNSKNRCIGVAVADNRGRREPISPEQIRLLSAFVDQAGIAIENANLYEDLQENNRNILRLKNYTESVLQSSLAGIISTDARGSIARWNRAAEETLRKTHNDFQEKKLTDLIESIGVPDPQKFVLLAMINRVQETGIPFHQPKFTLSLHNREPITLNIMLSRLPDHNQEGTGIVLIFEDVTQEVRLEGKLKEMHRLADIGQLGAKMAHEVRNALSPIKGAAQIIRLEAESQNISTEWPDIIIAEVDGLSRLTSEMLDFARPIPIDPQPLDVEELLTGAVQLLSAFLEENRTTVKWDLPHHLPDFYADPIQIGQVVRNILMNAAQSMPDGGTLTLSAEFDPVGKMLAIRFRDSGIGIPESDLDRIFRPFVTTKLKGTGLGLPIVQKIVHQHGGQVLVQSRVGEGTCFSVVLPLHPPRTETTPDESPLISPRPAGHFPDN